MMSASLPVNSPKASAAIPYERYHIFPLKFCSLHFTWTPPRARISVAPAFFMAYRVLGCTFPVALLVGAVQIIFFTYIFLVSFFFVFVPLFFYPRCPGHPRRHHCSHCVAIQAPGHIAASCLHGNNSDVNVIF